MLLNDAKLRELFQKLGRTYASGNVIFLEEERGEEMYIVVSGEVEILKTFRDQELFGGSQVTLGTTQEVLSVLGPGDFFGEMALWNDEPRMATARAKSTLEVIVLSKADVEQLMLRSPAIAIQMMKSICARLRDVTSSPRVEQVLPKIQEAIAAASRRRQKEPVTIIKEPVKKMSLPAPDDTPKTACVTCGRAF